MSRRNPRVPIVNTATRAAIFERQSGGHDRGSVTLEPNQTYHERGVDLTYEQLVLRNSSGKFTNHVISMDDLNDDRYERFEVTYDSDHDFQLVRHPRRTWIQKITGWNPFKSRSTDGTLPTYSNNNGHG